MACFRGITPSLQDHLFDLCKTLLSPHGIAFLSYNVFPGWDNQYYIREKLKEANQGIEDIELRLKNAKKYLSHWLEKCEQENVSPDFYTTLISVNELAQNNEQMFYFAHEYLEDENHPFTITDFIERVASKGMQYLADAGRSDLENELLDSDFEGEEVDEKLFRYDQESSRKLRQSLVCHADIKLNKRKLSTEN